MGPPGRTTRIVFKISPAGQESVLYTFGGVCDPTGGVTLDSSGNLYGVTKRCGADGQGVLYKLTPSGTETVLYSFNGKSGITPAAWFWMRQAEHLWDDARWRPRQRRRGL